MQPSRRMTIFTAGRLQQAVAMQSACSIPCSSTRLSMKASAKTRPTNASSSLHEAHFQGSSAMPRPPGPATWAAAGDTLKREITAGLDFSASGLPYWTTDTGGFFRPGNTQYTDPAYQERFLRWLEFSTFTPLMRVHGYQTDTEFWRFGSQVESIARKYLDMRYQMLPYLYSEAAAVTMQGSTLLRPLVMDFASDPKALRQNYEFMFGHELLVAPVIAPSTDRMSVYLPHNPHGWFNFWTGEHVPGGAALTTDARLGSDSAFCTGGFHPPFRTQRTIRL